MNKQEILEFIAKLPDSTHFSCVVEVHSEIKDPKTMQGITRNDFTLKFSRLVVRGEKNE